MIGRIAAKSAPHCSRTPPAGRTRRRGHGQYPTATAPKRHPSPSSTTQPPASRLRQT